MRSQSKSSRVLFLVVLFTLAVSLTACSATDTGSASASVPPQTAPTATHAAPKPTATLSTGGQPTIGGPVADFQKQLGPNGPCPGNLAKPTCYCGTYADSPCDYSVTVTVVDAAVTKITILGLDTTKESWDLGFTTGTCILYMGGAQVAVVGGQVTKPGVYAFDLGSRRISLNIDAGTCLITLV